jgi:hypothetical protein
VTSPESPYVRDPLNPTDAELSAAITRSIELGQLLTVDEFLAAAAELGSAPAAEAAGRKAAAAEPAPVSEPEAGPEAEAEAEA